MSGARNPYGKQRGQPTANNASTPHANPNSDSNTLDLSNKPLLKNLWEKLRPFQREAVEFCVLGKRYSRQLHGTTTVSNTPLPNNFPRGRVLIGDEMGLVRQTVILGLFVHGVLFSSINFSRGKLYPLWQS